jgi:cytochrome c553
VPAGSLAKGQMLVMTGMERPGGPVKTVACATCHGIDMMGIGDFPGIGGRSPSYMARQLWDFKKGTRNGTYAAIMKPVVANLSADDVTAIVAYLASLKPPAPAYTTTSSR